MPALGQRHVAGHHVEPEAPVRSRGSSPDPNASIARRANRPPSTQSPLDRGRDRLQQRQPGGEHAVDRRPLRPPREPSDAVEESRPIDEHLAPGERHRRREVGGVGIDGQRLDRVAARRRGGRSRRARDAPRSAGAGPRGGARRASSARAPTAKSRSDFQAAGGAGVQLTGAFGVLVELAHERRSRTSECSSYQPPTTPRQRTGPARTRGAGSTSASSRPVRRPGERHAHSADDGDLPEQLDELVGLVTERFREQVVRGDLHRRHRRARFGSVSPSSRARTAADLRPNRRRARSCRRSTPRRRRATGDRAARRPRAGRTADRRSRSSSAGPRAAPDRATSAGMERETTTSCSPRG